MKKVSIIDYGLGNLLSIIRALESLGVNVKVCQSRKDILNASYLVLPGVGAFPYGMKELRGKGYFEDLKEYSYTERPLLGICLGMQMLFSHSEELESTDGLNFINGAVKRLPKNNTNGSSNKVPNVGWNQIFFSKDLCTKGNIFHKIPNGAFMYFVHSYFPNEVHQKILFLILLLGILNLHQPSRIITL